MQKIPEMCTYCTWYVQDNKRTMCRKENKKEAINDECSVFFAHKVYQALIDTYDADIEEPEDF